MDSVNEFQTLFRRVRHAFPAPVLNLGRTILRP
jgi:hypothetical protein